MTIRKLLGFTLAGTAAALVALVAGCGSSSSSGPASALGESCTRTADCQSGLVCIADTCFAKTTPVEAGAEAGEAGPMMMAGPQLGQIGEACQTSRDCASNLACVVSGGSGVCDIVSYGLTAGGKTCSGECEAASDCCELPVGALGETEVISDAGFLTIVEPRTCQDVLQLLLDGDPAVCTAAHPSPTAARACFYYQTYCTCAATTWTCTANECVYTASCQAGSTENTLGGCPSETRTARALATTCGPTNLCQAGGCSKAADCEGTAVADVSDATCNGGDCTCYQGACYIACAKDIDCSPGYSCNATTMVCSPTVCMTNADCVSQTGEVRSTCQAGACKLPCMSDHDCSPSGDLGAGAFNGTICGSGGFCVPFGCTSDSDCSSGSVHTFCVTPPATTTTARSAITN
ncbi:MAG: hypothetical protein ACLP1X_26475 [Polyangiaceae bacterium]|jgi:hypothetical protein